jgi:hypothetical protein
MRTVFVLFIVLLASCAGQKKLASVTIDNQENTGTDSVEYELIVFDPDFESWYLSHSKPDWYFSQSYYEMWNRQYVSAWNNKAMNPKYSRFFETTIDYDPFVDYGLELNHRLFYYFMFVENRLKIPILPPGMGPRIIL